MKHSASRLQIVSMTLILVGACSFGQIDSNEAMEGRPEIDDSAGREAVPTVQLMTKTKSDDPTRYEMASMIVESWQAAGIDAELLPVGAAELSSRTFTGKDYDALAVYYGPTPERLDPENLLGRFYSGNATDDGTNVSLFRNKEYDDAYLAQSRAVSMDDRRSAVFEAQRILYEQMPAVPVLYDAVGAAYRSDRWDGIDPSLGYPVFNVLNMTSATPKDERDSIVVGTIFDPPTLNPVSADLFESQLPLSLIYDTLLTISPDGNAANRAAESVQVNGATITVRLRDRMAFSDGTPVTAADVAFTVNYLRDHKAPLFATGLEPVKSVAAVDDLTVKFQLDSPLSSFPDAVLTQMPILPEHIWSRVSDPADFANDDPVGSGPFTFEGRDLGVSVSFAANPNHYDPPHVSTLELMILASPEAGVGGLESGELDVYDDVQPAVQFASLEDADGVTVVETESHGWRGLHLNTSRAPFDNAHFRRALADLIPYEDVADVVMPGAGSGGSVIASRLEDWHNPDLDPFAYNPSAAMAELKEGGYAFGPDDRLYLP